MATHPPILTAFQKKVLAAEKAKKAAVLVRQQPEAAAAIAHLLPSSSAKRRETLSRARRHVLRLKNHLEQEALDAETARTTRDTLGKATAHLKTLLAKSIRHRALKHSRTVGTVALNETEQKQRLNTVLHSIAALKSQIAAAKAHYIKASTPELKQKAATRLTVLHTTLAGLHFRQRLLMTGRGVHRNRVADPHQMSHQLKPLGLPRLFRSPDRSEAATAIRLVAANRPRRAGETEDQYRGTLKAYTKRALLRKINKPHLSNEMGVVEGVQETLAEDSPAIEEAASMGSVPPDEVGNVVDAAIQDASEEMEQSIIDFDPEAPATVQRGVIKENLQAAADEVIAQATQEEAALAAEGLEPVDAILPVAGSEGAATPFYRKKEFLIPAAIAVAALLVLRR